MDGREQFEQVLAEFGEKLNAELKLVDDRCEFTVDGAVEIEIDYYPESDMLVAWATVGELPKDDLAGARALALLALNGLGNGNFHKNCTNHIKRAETNPVIELGKIELPRNCVPRDHKTQSTN